MIFQQSALGHAVTPASVNSTSVSPASVLPPMSAKATPLVVLLVEDDDIDAKLVSLCAAMMENHRLEIVRALSYTDARSRLATRRFDLCIVDFWLGCESSIRLLAELDSPALRTPALVLTSLSTPDIRRMCITAGATVFMGKADLSAKALDDAVKAALALAKAPMVPAPELSSAPPRPASPAGLDLLRSMSETARFGMFETFWSTRSAATADLSAIVQGAVEGSCVIFEERGQAVAFDAPAEHAPVRGDPAGIFFVVFEMLERASRRSAREAALKIEIRATGRRMQVTIEGTSRGDLATGAMDLGPLCAQILGELGATIRETSDPLRGYVLTIAFDGSDASRTAH